MEFPPTDPSSIKLAGQLDLRLRHALERVVADPTFDERFVLQDVVRLPNYRRQFDDWAGDLSGRYIGAVAAAAAVTGGHYPRLHQVAHALPAYQRPSGLVGSDNSFDTVDFSVIWGQGRLLTGLMDYHAVFPSEDVFACAERLGEFYRRSWSTWAERHVRAHRDFPYYTQAIEGLVMLFRSSGVESFLAIARAMGLLWLQAGADRSLQGRHSHALLLTLLGLLDLYDCTHEQHFLDEVRETADAISTDMVFVDGAPPEFFPRSERNEGCSIADWLHLNLRLGDLTGEARFFQAAEGVWRNALYANQAANGGFCHRHFSTSMRGYSGEGSEAWWCCSLHGLRTLARIPSYLYTRKGDELRVQFMESAAMDVQTTSGHLRIVQTTSYPSRGETVLRIQEAPAEGITLVLRLPDWVDTGRIQLSVGSMRGAVEHGYLRLPGPARAGDSVTVTFPIGLQRRASNGVQSNLWWGPLLMACAIPGGTACAVVVPPDDGEGLLHLPPADAPEHPYAIAGIHFRVIATGTPVSQPVERLHLNQLQWGLLRPFAEQTQFPSPPPAVLSPPLVQASGEALESELADLLSRAPG